MEKTCVNCRYKDVDYDTYPCKDCFHKYLWEEWTDTNYYPTPEDLMIRDLENIKGEIEKLEYDDFDCNLALPAFKVYEIIDKYISDLKGEQK